MHLLVCSVNAWRTSTKTRKKTGKKKKRAGWGEDGQCALGVLLLAYTPFVEMGMASIGGREKTGGR